MPSLKRKAEQNLDSDEDDEIEDLQLALQSIFSSVSNSNKICDLLRYLQVGDLDEDETALTCMGLEKWFRLQVEQGIFKPTKVSSKGIDTFLLTNAVTMNPKILNII